MSTIKVTKRAVDILINFRQFYACLDILIDTLWTLKGRLIKPGGFFFIAFSGRFLLN
jgi:hypothetical protein